MNTNIWTSGHWSQGQKMSGRHWKLNTGNQHLDTESEVKNRNSAAVLQVWRVMRAYFREKVFPVSTSLSELRKFYHNYSEKKFISTKLFALSLYKYQALLVIFLTSERLLVERVNSFRNIFLCLIHVRTTFGVINKSCLKESLLHLCK